MSHNDLSLHPHGSDAVYCGVANPSPHSNGLGALDGSGSGYNSSSKEDAAKQEVIEAQPGLIESTELAPLGEEKIAPGQTTVESIVSQAQTLGKQAYDAVVGSTESK